MRYFATALLFLVAACSSQARDDADPWEGYEPDPDRTTYDETYTAPNAVDRLLARARKAEREGRDDQARVEYHAAFKRDRWHPDANEGYQDLMLRNGLFETVWQEYLDLWQREPERGDAFWFHLRPMVLQREGQAITPDKLRKLSDEQYERVKELKAEAALKAESGDREGAIGAVDAALRIGDSIDLHRKRIELLQTGDYVALLEEYAELADENPQSGDKLYLHGLVLSLRDPVRALNLLREGWILDLPGYWLRFGVAEVCIGMGDNESDERSRRGWYTVAREFARQCTLSLFDDDEAAAMLRYAQDKLKQ